MLSIMAFLLLNTGGVTMNKIFLTVDELAESLKVPKSWIYSRTRETGPGTIPRIRVGKYIRFEIHKVMDWLQQRQKTE